MKHSTTFLMVLSAIFSSLCFNDVNAATPSGGTVKIPVSSNPAVISFPYSGNCQPDVRYGDQGYWKKNGHLYVTGLIGEDCWHYQLNLPQDSKHLQPMIATFSVDEGRLTYVWTEDTKKTRKITTAPYYLTMGQSLVAFDRLTLTKKTIKTFPSSISIGNLPTLEVGGASYLPLAQYDSRKHQNVLQIYKIKKDANLAFLQEVAITSAARNGNFTIRPLLTADRQSVFVSYYTNEDGGSRPQGTRLMNLNLATGAIVSRTLPTPSYNGTQFAKYEGQDVMPMHTTAGIELIDAKTLQTLATIPNRYPPQDYNGTLSVSVEVPQDAPETIVVTQYDHYQYQVGDIFRIQTVSLKDFSVMADYTATHGYMCEPFKGKVACAEPYRKDDKVVLYDQATGSEIKSVDLPVPEYNSYGIRIYRDTVFVKFANTKMAGTAIFTP